MIQEKILKMLNSKSTPDIELACAILENNGVTLDEFKQLDNLWFRASNKNQLNREFWWIPNTLAVVNRRMEFEIYVESRRAEPYIIKINDT